MNWWRRFRHREHLDRQLDAELRDHLDRLATGYVADGMNPSGAQRKARLEFGGLDQVKEACRDGSVFSTMNGVGQEVRVALRSLRATPVVTTVAILSLALGIGANTAIFSLVNSLVLRTLPVVEPQRLAIVSSEGRVARGVRDTWSFATWEQFRRRSGIFDGALAWSAEPLSVGNGEDTQPVDGLFTSGDFFATLGVSALLGRTFTTSDDAHGGGPDGAVAIISYRFWQQRFGGALDVLGSTIVVVNRTGIIGEQVV